MIFLVYESISTKWFSLRPCSFLPLYLIYQVEHIWFFFFQVELTKAMVMEKPSPLLVGREFVRQYYTLLNQAPDMLHRFYGKNSSYVHGGLDSNESQQMLSMDRKKSIGKWCHKASPIATLRSATLMLMLLWMTVWWSRWWACSLITTRLWGDSCRPLSLLLRYEKKKDIKIRTCFSKDC